MTWVTGSVFGPSMTGPASSAVRRVMLLVTVRAVPETTPSSRRSLTASPSGAEKPDLIVLPRIQDRVHGLARHGEWQLDHCHRDG